MSNKSLILRAFNNNFFELIDTIITYFPERVIFKTAKTNMELLKKTNPTILIKVWLSSVYTPYVEEINNGDVNFFINKDYSDDLKDTQEQNKIIDFINDMRDNVMELPDSTKDYIMSYVQSLSKMSVQYAL